jgi:hypothetical protein
MTTATLYRALRQLTTILVLEKHILETLDNIAKKSPDFSYVLIKQQEEIVARIRDIVRRYDQFLKPIK